MTKYNTLIPDKIEVEVFGPGMTDILATDHKGDQQKLMVYPEDIDTLIEDLQKARLIDLGVKTMFDMTAMNKIHRLLDGVEWSPDTLDEIRVLVERTGRPVGDIEDLI